MRFSALACAAVLAAGWTSGCAHQGAGGGRARALAAQDADQRNGGSGPRATGTWDWIFRATDDGGNLRVEQEEWHLLQKGMALQGYYDRAVTLISTDDRLFKCNQQLGYTRFTRVRVEGEVQGVRLTVREIDYRTRPGPCDDGARILVDYEGVVGEKTMKLFFAARQGQQTLHRREGEGPVLAQLVGFEERPRPLPPSVRSETPVTGVWEWELKSVDAEGDARVEREEWHLTETSDGITGYYQRRVVRSRADGVFACSGRPEFETTTRYDITGQRAGDTVTLTETAYQADKGKCDNGLRRLDVYQGSVSKNGGELILTWGSGNQVLRRKSVATRD